ncbi:MAG: xanthine dehydrogenase family protein molybdopterin-binding subunit [Candidatus Caldarchaeum sp.]|uniref:Xanthine dehydrogenase family protein molybdopterin-binding subunit n=1 Tax=Caldiarchaeum subterraneum TaxID=311458 RepID=A0A7C4E0R7_CALS0
MKLQKRVEDPRLLRGEGQFIDDLIFPKMLHLVFVRSPYGHAKIKSINSNDALKKAVAVIDGKTVANETKPLYTLIRDVPYYGIAVGKARFFGEPVAMVAAETLGDALDASEEVYIDYEPLPPIVDPEEAVNSSNLVHENLGSNVALSRRLVFGEVEKMFAEADTVVKEKFYFDRYAAAPIETCGVVAVPDKGGSLTVYDNQQTPQLFKKSIAQSLGIQPEKLRFIEHDIGGGFGVKIMLYPIVFLTCYAALKLGKPVKWVETRREHLTAMAHNSNRVTVAEMALRKDGRVTGYRTSFIEDVGAYARLPDPGGTVRSLMTYLGCYDIQNVDVEFKVVLTNKCPTGPVRGYGCQQAYFVLERMMDIAARELGLTPVEIRLKNMVEKEKQPYRTVFGSLYDGGDYKATLLKAWRLSQAEKFLDEGDVGVGVACVVEPAVTNLARNKLLFPEFESSGSGEGAVVRLEESGTITVYAASIPQGQGHATVLTELVSELLGVKPEQVRVIFGDTDFVYPSPYGGTWASRFSVMTVAAVKKSCETLKQRILEIAAEILETSTDDLEIRDGKISVKGSEVSISLEKIAAIAYRNSLTINGKHTSLQAEYFYEFPTFNTGEPGKINMSATYGNSAHVAVVRVDRETGEVKILRYVAVHDCGKILNKKIVDGQILGGVLQGIGATLYEELVYDENGQLLTSHFSDYLLPTAMETPEIIIDHIETPSLFSELGSKGMGEGPLIPVAAAIVNALEDATKTRLTRSHLSPGQLWTAIHRQRL